MPCRYFVVYDVPPGQVRGGHAHHAMHEFMVAVHGRVEVRFDDTLEAGVAVLDAASLGLHVPPLVWSSQHFVPGAVLLVLASTGYDPASYMRDRGEFEALHGKR